MLSSVSNVLSHGKSFLRWLLQPNPARFLVVWYTARLVFNLKALVVNGLIRRQPIRIAWVPVTGFAETLYLLAEVLVVGAIAWQAWRFHRANWRVAFLYEWYSLIEYGLSLFNPRLWTYAVNQLAASPTPIVWDATAMTLIRYAGFTAIYTFIHHGLPLLMLYQVSHQRVGRVQPALAR